MSQYTHGSNCHDPETRFRSILSSAMGALVGSKFTVEQAERMKKQLMGLAVAIDARTIKDQP